MKIYPHQINNMQLTAKKTYSENYGLAWFRVFIQFKDHILIEEQPIRKMLVDIAPGYETSEYYLNGGCLAQLEAHAGKAFLDVLAHYKFPDDQVKFVQVKIFNSQTYPPNSLLEPVINITLSKGMFGRIRLKEELDLSGTLKDYFENERRLK